MGQTGPVPPVRWDTVRLQLLVADLYGVTSALGWHHHACFILTQEDMEASMNQNLRLRPEVQCCGWMMIDFLIYPAAGRVIARD